MDQDDAPKKKRKRIRFSNCFGGCCSLPILSFFYLTVIYTSHNRPPVLTFPSRVMPPDNAYHYFVKAGHLAMTMQHQSPYSMIGPPSQTFTLANLAACAKDAQPTHAALRQGLQLSYMNPRSRLSRSDVFPEKQPDQELARTLAGEADYYALTRQYGRAVDTRLDCMEFGVMIPQGDVCFAGAIGIECEALGESKLEPLLPHLTDQELTRVAERLARIAAKRVSYADMALEEGYCQAASDIELLKELAHSKGDTFSIFVYSFGMAQDKGSQPIQATNLAIRQTLADKTEMLRENLRYAEAVAAEARQPYQGKSRVPIPNNFLAQIRGGAVVRLRPVYVNMEAADAVLCTEVALYRYQKAHGRFPDTLSALIPTYLRAVPNDPCGGGADIPLRYQAKQGGQSFLLYSLGPDLKDDGGQPGEYLGASPGDIVAGKLGLRKTKTK